ncbi:arsenite methyltransferase [Sporolactobacillus sp. CPB3-1]|uniref:Arsenite methyltransferase n=1 Tax=Sporolactobacillus mangiferae TaxID=2940498 RepID=A0ABT0MAR4_9BACL|nr:arsenite methyltransferase [Sporolactobacillus mangiferae]MCL1631956.1 arsenite methyltransferase [Sporolactobacillus mangiferae]
MALTNDQIRQNVRNRYKKIALQDVSASSCGCSSEVGCCEMRADHNHVARQLGYSAEELDAIPEGANLGLGCGNPQAIASLKTGEHVLDLGSGGGFDCFLAARQVGASGQVIGVDMTAEMVSRARQNADRGQFVNVDFRLGEIEHLPVADQSIDVILSNCVINLSPDKLQVFREAFRVLKKGGRLAISDVVLTAELPDEIKNDLEVAYSGCISGASSIADLQTMMKQSGLAQIEIKPKDESKAFIREWIPGAKIDKYIVSATIQAVKPLFD